MFFIEKIKKNLNLNFDTTISKEKLYQNLFNNFSKRIYINKNISSQKNSFLEMCCYHYNYIKMNKITHVVYWATPHFHFGITLFYVADILGLKQYILHETDIENTFIVRKNWFSFHRYRINKKNVNILKNTY